MTDVDKTKWVEHTLVHLHTDTRMKEQTPTVEVSVGVALGVA